LFILSLLCACDGPARAPAQPAPAQAVDTDALPAFVGRVWISTTPGHGRGTILVFLPDKTLVHDSCFETFRVSKWGVISASRIRWIEESIPIEAEFSQPSSRELVLEPVGTGRQENYVAISVPYVCPDMPR
jgi:hypothetical protein